MVLLLLLLAGVAGAAGAVGADSGSGAYGDSHTALKMAIGGDACRHEKRHEGDHNHDLLLGMNLVLAVKVPRQDE